MLSSQYQIPSRFNLEVGVMDWDRLGADDLVGMSKIDLENRFFSNEWKSMKFKPIEYR